MSEHGNLLVRKSTLYSIIVISKIIFLFVRLKLAVQSSIAVDKPVLWFGIITEMGELEGE